MNNDFNLVVNASQFREQLRILSADIRIKGVNSAVRAAAQVFRKAVIANAPVLKQPTKNRVAGTLKRAIFVKRSKRSTSGAVRYFIGVRTGTKAAKSNRDAFYWRFLEAGWMPRGPGAKLKGGTRSRAFQRRQNKAAGAKKIQYKFIQPAFDQAKKNAETAFSASMEKYLKKIK
jgi:HK97 gp10 family phage protein